MGVRIREKFVTLPNGAKDEYIDRVTTRRTNDYILKPTDIVSVAFLESVAIFTTNIPFKNNAKLGTTNIDGLLKIFLNGSELQETSLSVIDSLPQIGKYYYRGDGRLAFVDIKTLSIASAQQKYGGALITYQLDKNKQSLSNRIY